jgi:hypothetical protein
MVEFRWLFEKDIIIAYLTQACVSHSYKVETVKDIAAIWKDLRQGINLRDDVDLLSGVLACGRIMDLKEEISTHQAVTNIIRSIRIEMEKENIIPNSSDKEFMYAHLSAAVVENTDKVMALRDIVQTWMDLRDTVEMSSALDMVCGFLTVGRILELRVEIENSDSVKNIFMMLHGELEEQEGLEEISYNDYAAAIITSAYVEITPKLEKIRDIINTWQWARENLPIENKLDFISAILAAGRIKDLDAKHMLLQESLSEIINRIKERIEVDLL